jgi:murein L,D-transpeptidase YcbB/YkuD
MSRNTKKLTSFILAITFIATVFTFQACRKKKARSDMGKILFDKSQNKVFKDITPEGFAPFLQKALVQQKAKLVNPSLITSWYEQNGYDPSFVMEHLPNDDLKTFLGYLINSKDHGLNPVMFQTNKIGYLLNKFYNRDSIKTTTEAYQDMAQLEILVANAMVNYSNALQYGVMNPRKIYANYFTATKRPDSASMVRVFNIQNFKTYLDSIQPKDSQYIALQTALKSGQNAPGLSQEETQRILVVNLDRLRWKNKPTESKYVIVNIPDFQLNVMEDGKSTLNMKVCVGEGRNKDHANTLVDYDESDKVDRPFSHETPQLNSLIYVAEVNPVWNIPSSIATKEIMTLALNDRYYLSNKNIDVYKNGQKIEDSETINWENVKKNPDDYSFKQQPGADNSLGKVKFLFPNKTNVYLHDTPAQLPFKKDMRAVSHGCVRLEKPLDFAKTLFGDGEKYNTIAKDMTEDNNTPTQLTLPKKVPVYITYITCWADDKGTLQFRHDIYALDIVLYGHMQRFFSA